MSAGSQQTAPAYKGSTIVMDAHRHSNAAAGNLGPIPGLGIDKRSCIPPASGPLPSTAKNGLQYSSQRPPLLHGSSSASAPCHHTGSHATAQPHGPTAIPQSRLRIDQLAAAQRRGPEPVPQLRPQLVQASISTATAGLQNLRQWPNGHAAHLAPPSANASAAQTPNASAKELPQYGTSSRPMMRSQAAPFAASAAYPSPALNLAAPRPHAFPQSRPVNARSVPLHLEKARRWWHYFFMPWRAWKARH